MDSTQGDGTGDAGKQHQDTNNFKLSTFLTDEQNIRVRRELEEDERRKEQPKKKNKGKAKAKDPSNAAKEEDVVDDEDEEPRKKKGQGNYGQHNAPPWTDQESLTFLKIVRDAPNDKWGEYAEALAAAGHTPGYERSVNGLRPQYLKLAGANREKTVEVLPGKIAALEKKIAEEE